MFPCKICKKEVDDKGFRLFITYQVVSFYNPPVIEPEKIPVFGSATHQIRFCDKCLMLKKGKNLKIEL